MTLFPPNCHWCGHSPDQHEADHCTRSIETRAGTKPCPCAAHHYPQPIEEP